MGYTREQAHQNLREILEMIQAGTDEHAELNAWQIAHIQGALEECQSGAPGISHEEVAKWMNSWGTDHELPRPKPENL